MSEIASKVQKIIVDKLGVEESEVVATASFTNDRGADSLDIDHGIRKRIRNLYSRRSGRKDPDCR